MTIRALTAADIPAAQRLREQAGWNQTADDWRRLLAWEPAGCWAFERDGQLVGTATVTTYGRRVAWVGMVLVHVDHRRQGIGQALLRHAISFLERRGVQTIALDATPAGKPLYDRLGFVDAFGLERRRGPVPPPRPPAGAPEAPAIRPFTPADLATVTAFDRRVFGVERGHILAALVTAHPAAGFIAERHGELVGYVLGRPGARAWHLGPLAANDPTTAERLARAALRPRSGPAAPTPDTPARVEAATPEVVMDVVVANPAAITLADALGLAPVRPFIRMMRGVAPPRIDADRLYTSAGPELG